MSDDDEGGEWLLYAELAERRGIDRDSANRLVIRHRWRRQKGNDGKMRVLVPANYLHSASPDNQPDSQTDNQRDMPSRHIRTLEAAIAALEAAQKASLDALERERRRVDATEARAEADRAAAAEREAAAAEREAQLRGQIEALIAAATARREPLAWRDVLAWFRKRDR